MNKFQIKIAEKTNILTREFINNGAHADAVVEDYDFRSLIDHLASDGQNFTGFYQHMGRRGMQL